MKRQSASVDSSRGAAAASGAGGTRVLGAALIPLLFAAPPSGAQTCPEPPAGPPRPRVEVHIFQPSCDAPLLSGKRVVGRVWAIWMDDPEAGETEPAFRARITVRDGAGEELAQGTHVFWRYPWDDLDTSRAQHTWQFAFTPRRGVTESPITVEVEPLKEDDADLFPDPGVRPFVFEPGNPARADRRRILRISYVIPLVGPWAGGDYSEALTWVSKNGDLAEEFIVQNFPVHDVKRAGSYGIEVDVPSRREAPCAFRPAYTCALYETWGLDEQVELYLARQFVALADVSIVVILLPPGYLGNLLEGRTIFFDPAYRGLAALSSADFRAPDHPVIVLPVSSSPWILAHEMAHVFRGPGHVDPDQARVLTEDGEVQQTARSEGIHAFRVPLWGTRLTANKHSVEGNGEDRVLEALLEERGSEEGVKRRFVSDGVYGDLLEEVRESESEIWASAGSPGRGMEVAWRDVGNVVPASGPSAHRGPMGASTPRVPGPEATLHLLVGGAIGPEGRVALDPLRVGWMKPATEPPSSGPYRVEVRDLSGGVLAGRAVRPPPSLVHDPEGRVDPGSSLFVALPYSPEAHRVVVLDETGSELAAVERSGESVDLAFEDLDGRPEEGTAVVEWSVSGGGGDAGVDLFYSPDGDGGWVPIGWGLTGGSAVVSTPGLRRGPDPTFRLVATDGFGYASEDRDADFDHFDAWSLHPAAGDSTATDEVWVLLNTELDPDGVEPHHFILEDASGARVAARVGYDVDASRLWLVPHEPLPAGRAYRARLSDDLTDRWGHRLREDLEWTFRSVADTEAPRVVEAAPRDGDITIPVTVRPAVTFDEPLGGELGSGLRLETAEGGAVAGSTRYEPERNRLVFEPSSELERRTVYRLVVSPGIVDEAGNPVGEVAPVTFTTGGRITVGGGR